MDLGLLQRQVADIIGVDKATIESWELTARIPNVRAWPAVLEFLGYDPRPVGTTIGERLRRHRKGLGLSGAEAAKSIGVDPSTISKWECQSDKRHDHRSIHVIAAFLGCNPLARPVSLREYIRQARQLAGLSQEDLGMHLGTCQHVVSRWELGKSIPSNKQLTQIEQICHFRSGVRITFSAQSC